jgi:hypothetical protein
MGPSSSPGNPPWNPEEDGALTLDTLDASGTRNCAFLFGPVARSCPEFSPSVAGVANGLGNGKRGNLNVKRNDIDVCEIYERYVRGNEKCTAPSGEGEHWR